MKLQHHIWLFRLAIGLLYLLSTSNLNALAQANKLNVPVQFDEYGFVGGCDHSARLDNFAIALQNDPNLEGVIVTYGPDGKSSGTGRYVLSMVKSYLVNSRGLAEDRFTTVYGGRNSELGKPRTQLWLVPRGTQPPQTPTYENDFATFQGKFAEYEAWDSIAVGGGSGPPIGHVTLASFADLLLHRKKTVAYIVSYNGKNAAPGAWRRVAQLEIDSLEERGVGPERIKVIFGGRDKETKVQLWLLPEDDPPPFQATISEPTPSKTVQIGSFNDYELADPKSERWAFNGFVDVLRSSEELRAYIVVRVSSPLEVETPFDVEFNIQPANILELAQKWRSELSERLKLGHERVIVLFARPRYESDNSVETWIAPAGSPLPDLDAEDPDDETLDNEDEPAD